MYLIGSSRSVRVLKALPVPLAALLAGLCPAPAALSAGGDIIIQRTVQPRVATRSPMIPDPNPLVVNPKPNSVINQGLEGMAAPGELSDNDFAGITGGHSSWRARGAFADLPSSGRSPQHGGGAGVPASPAAGHSGGALGSIDGQINRSLQQGLRPLQGLSGR